MRRQHSFRFYFLSSLGMHIVLLLVLILSLQFSTPMPVVNNSDKDTKILSAMVLKEPLPIKINTPEKPQNVSAPKPEKKMEVKNQKILPNENLKQKAIALKILKERQREKLAKQLLADLQKDLLKQKKKKQELKTAAEKNLQKQLLEAQKKLTATKTSEMRGVIDKYKALILQAISQQWLIPGNANKKLFCELLIRVAPGGSVLDVQLTKTSGDPTLDRSARAAVFKASPLPVPKETDAFEPFRQFVLRVKPENVISSDSWMG